MNVRRFAVSMLAAAFAGSASAQNFEVAMMSDHFLNTIVNPMGSSIPVNTSETFSFAQMLVGPDHFLSFDVIATNTGGTVFDLTLTNLEFRTTVPTPGSGPLPNGEFLRLILTADFDSLPGVYLPGHEVDGTMWMLGGQSGFVEKASLHCGSPVWAIGTGLSTSGSFSTGVTFGPPITVGTTYTIWTEYTFGILAGTSSYGSIELPSSGHDRGSLVPAPATAGLLLAAGVLAGRRRGRTHASSSPTSSC